MFKNTSFLLPFHFVNKRTFFEEPCTELHRVLHKFDINNHHPYLGFHLATMSLIGLQMLLRLPMFISLGPSLYSSCSGFLLLYSLFLPFFGRLAIRPVSCQPSLLRGRGSFLVPPSNAEGHITVVLSKGFCFFIAYFLLLDLSNNVDLVAEVLTISTSLQPFYHLILGL